MLAIVFVVNIYDTIFGKIYFFKRAVTLALVDKFSVVPKFTLRSHCVREDIHSAFFLLHISDTKTLVASFTS